MTTADIIKSKFTCVDIARMFGIDLSPGIQRCIFKWHKDRNPSFSYVPEWDYFNCFSEEGISGDCIFLYSLLAEIDNSEAFIKLKKMAGINNGKYDPEEYQRQKNEREQVLEVYKDFMDSCVRELKKSSVMQNKCITKWGFNQDIQEKYRFGFCNSYVYSTLIDKYGKSRLKQAGIMKSDGWKIFENRVIQPYLNPVGNPVYFIGRIPPEKGDSNKPGRYKKVLIKKENHPDVSDTVRNPLYVLRGDNFETCYITEGIPDSISIHEATGNTVISPVTITFQKNDIPKIARAAKCYKEIVIVNDNETNKRGESGAFNTVRELRKNGITGIKLITLPLPHDKDKIDANDYLRDPENHNEFQKLPRQKLWQIQAEKLDLTDLEDNIKPIFQEIIEEEGEAKAWIKAEKLLTDKFNVKIRQLSPYKQIFNSLLKSDKKEDTPDIKLDNYPTIAKTFIEKYSPFTVGETLYLYDNKKGVYSSKTNFLKTEIQELMGDKTTSYGVNEVLQFIKRNKYREPDSLNPLACRFLNLKNGMYDLHALENPMLAHSPEYLSTIQFPIEFDENAVCPRIDDFLKSTLPELVENDSVPLIEEIFGYLLIPDTRKEKGFLFVGNGENGKSTLIDLLRIAIGDNNCSSISLHEMVEDRFALADLYGKLFNACDDLESTTIKTTGKLKKAISGQSIRAQWKHQAAFNFKPFAKHIFSCNELPGTRDRSHAFWRRWIVIKFNQKFPPGKRNDNLIFELTNKEELSGFFIKGIKGLMRLARNGSFSENESTKEALGDYQLSADPVRNYVDECCTLNPQSKVNKQNLYQSYETFCKENNLRPLSKIRFGRHLKECFPITQKKIGNKRIWQGIDLTEY